MKRAGPVVIIGDANMDLLVRLPRPEDRQPPEPDLSLGGTGANTAVALVQLGLPTTIIGALGDDGYGRATRRALSAAGIGVDNLTVPPDSTTMLVLGIIDQHGERTLLGWPRRGAAQAKLTRAQVDPALIAGAAWVHTTGICLVETPSREAVLYGLDLARAAGVPTSLDLNLRLGLEEGQLPPAFRAAVEAAIERVDVVLGSAVDELPYLATGPEPVALARSLAAGRRTVIVRLGSQGVQAVDATGGISQADAYPVSVVSTVGAGDAFNAGFIAARVAGRSLAEALCWGNGVAALTISAPVRPATFDRARLLATIGALDDGLAGPKPAID